MFDSAELRVHMTGKALLRPGARGQGQGHETTWAQIVAHELGMRQGDRGDWQQRLQSARAGEAMPYVHWTSLNLV